MIAGAVLALFATVALFGLLNKPVNTTGASLPSGSTEVTPAPSGIATTGVGETPTPTATGSTGTEPTATPTATATATPPPTPTPPPDAVAIPFVPVVGFWSTDASITVANLRAAAGGTNTKYPELLLPIDDEAAVAAALGVTGYQTGTVDQIEAAVKAGAVGILRATDVTPRVHALPLNGVALFGNDRVRDLAQWPLTLQVSSSETWNQAGAWTLVAGGDIMMDRGNRRAIERHGNDPDYVLDGGTSRVTGVRCCSIFGYEYVTTRRTGNTGAMRDLFSTADVAMANLESAVLVNAPYHATGFIFTTPAAYLDALETAGIDFLSLGNNHIRNAAARGITTAITELDARGIEHSGAGPFPDNSKPGVVEVNGLRVAFLGCDAIRPGWAATPDKVGTFNCRSGDVAGKIRQMRPNYDVIVVMPHWGREYAAKPADYQRVLAGAWLAAGADVVIGAHSHWAGGMQDFDGKLALYSIGNFVFDQSWSRSTMQGVVPELTFVGTELVQVNLHPTLLIDSQPNFVAPTQGGQYVIDQMIRGSQGLLNY
ncbi:MAG TPA: CapA family protein [Candidatus Limnocylindrales bacterium]|nr:CapA family protein [Candidatus Limnocylindrales bacterium]